MRESIKLVTDSQPAVLIVAFNRPLLLQRVIDSLECVAPKRLYVALDGPRIGNESDVALCDASADVVASISWPCEVSINRQERNLGCRRGVSSAISWFFDHEEFGIILEDDCLPNREFFRFCDEMNSAFGSDERIGTISGNWFLGTSVKPDLDFLFSRYPLIWGWATWRRAWRCYDDAMAEWPELRDTDWLRTVCNGHEDAAAFWTSIFDKCYAGDVDSWAYRWTYSSWRAQLLSVTPTANLVSNIGFGPDSTHTWDASDSRAALATSKLCVSLVGPRVISADVSVDRLTDKVVFAIGSRPSRWRRLVRALLPTKVRVYVRQLIST